MNFAIRSYHAAIFGIAFFCTVALFAHTRTITDLAAALATAIWVAVFVANPGKYEGLMPVATILGIVALTFGVRIVLRGEVARNDFLQFYTGAKYVGALDFYRTAAAEATSESLSQGQFPMAFVRLPFYAWLLRPLTRFTYHGAYAIWQSFSAASFVAVVFLRRRHRWAVAVACAWSIPLAVAWVRGQDIGFILLILTFGMFLLENGWVGLGGVVLSLCALKWNLFVTLPLFLLRFRSARLLSGLLAGMSIILVISFAVAGNRWPVDYLQLLHNPALSPHLQTMPNLRGLLSATERHLPSVIVYVVAIIGVAIMAQVVVFRTASREYAMAATCISGLLITPHAYVYDCVLLVPSLVFLAFNTRSYFVRYLATLLLTPVFSLLLWSPTWHILSQFALLGLLLAMVVEQTTNEPKLAGQLPIHSPIAI